jgi:hypothetical protein
MLQSGAIILIQVRGRVLTTMGLARIQKMIERPAKSHHTFDAQPQVPIVKPESR